MERQKEIYKVILRRASRPRSGRDGVLICGAYGKGNAGDDSILEAIIGQMRDIDPDLPAVCIDPDAAGDGNALPNRRGIYV